MTRDPKTIREEAAVRVSVLKHNTGGTRATYAGTSSFWGRAVTASSLSRWARQKSTPLPGNMLFLRNVTS